MVPIHDTDVAEERWAKASWENYELWEKVEVRARKQKRLWIGATVIVFLVLSAMPVMVDKWPRWRTLSGTRQLAQEINRIRREASIDHAAYRLRFAEDGSLTYQVEKSTSCSVPHHEVVRTGALLTEATREAFRVLDTDEGQKIQIPGLVREICYDYLAGSSAVLHGNGVAGFAIAPVKDLTETGRIDRVSVLLLSGASAEISFD